MQDDSFHPDVVMMGIGYIGLPTSAVIASQRIKVMGTDVNSEFCKMIGTTTIKNIITFLVARRAFKGAKIPRNKTVLDFVNTGYIAG